ncbi:MAG TPA: DUF362 domain-containing protein [Candidatus Omnitrophota bacterium]|nr:DUF362 domain-containing protein [Candidatus Omnitrophota bacterium]
MKKSPVYTVSVNESDSQEDVAGKLERLLQAGRLLQWVAPGDRTAVKMHFGEQGNTGFVRPAYIRVICEAIGRQQGVPFLADTNTLYKGRRTTSAEHLKLAAEHGFVPAQVAAEVIIPDDTRKEEVREVPVNGAYVKTAKIAAVFREADGLVDVAHFKGHLMTGFGGVLKNAGMGCATREGKLFQHSDVAPFVITRKCTGCSSCSGVCPVQAIVLREGKAAVDPARCIGCASCIAACAYAAIDVKWESGGNVMQEKMAEYAWAVLQNKKGKSVFINFALKITRECDCLAKDDPRVVADIGIFASFDPVACDKACFDAVCARAGKDIFRELHPQRDGMKQLRHAAAMGLGALDYELIRAGE